MPPVPQHPLILVERIDYLANATRHVSLCVVDRNGLLQLRLYKWRWNPQQDAWRVSFANLNLEFLDLSRIVPGAINLAAKYGIQLPWAPQSEEQRAAIPQTAPPSTPRSAHPICISCGAVDEVVPITYGVQTPGDQGEEVNSVWGGLTFTVESPVWYCRNCERRWGFLVWTDTQVSGAQPTPELGDEDIPF